MGFAGDEAVARRLQVGEVGGFVRGVGDDEQEVDTGFGGQARHGGRADVLEEQDAVAERRATRSDSRLNR
ncbi:hypothetical protein BJF83_10020 [Nocardiopsis sp. CNR-923]|nr:hypothetical protein BJF83_10020 [Nocardiopsis sp. CNR-923]